LRQGTRVSVEDAAGVAIAVSKALRNYLVNEIVFDQLAGRENGFDFIAERRTGLTFTSQHFAG
jgi:hypothetical protein